MELVKKTFWLTVVLPVLIQPALSQEYRMGEDPTIRTCGGFFLDSGGTEGGYGPDESHTVTICSDQTQGTHIQLIFSAPEIRTGDQLCFYDGMDASATRLSCSGDFIPGNPFIIQATAANSSGCLTIVFKSNGSGQGEGWSADINCVASCQIIQADLLESVPIVSPADTGYIDACPGQPISLKAAGRYPQNGIVYQHSDASSRFTWNFGDGTSAVGPEVSHNYKKSGGYVVQLTITDQFGCQNTNFISQRVRISTRPDFRIGGDLPLEICAGDTVAVNAVSNRIDSSKTVSVIPTQGSFQFGGIRSDSLPLPDGTGSAYETSVNFTSFQPGQLLSDVKDLLSICVNIEHSWMRDLEISLSCPDGSSVLLHDHAGQTGGSVFLGQPIDNDDFGIRPGKGFDYCWTPDASNPDWLTYANTYFPTTLPPGDYQSFENLENLEGCPLNGEWTIRVEDLWGQDNGFIFSWGINFSPDLFPDLETFTPELVQAAWEPAPYLFHSENDSLAAAPRNAGMAQYFYTVTDDFGCVYDTTVMLKVLPPTDPGCYSCAELLIPVPDTVICQGEETSLNVAGAGARIDELTFESNPRYAFGFSNHPPADPYASSIEVGSVLPSTLTDPASQIISVCVDVETDWTGDIHLALQAPSGAILILSDGNGGDGDNFSNTCFRPDATTPVTNGNPPFTGNFQPQGNWNILRGTPIQGKWSLLVSDALGLEEMGRINSWSITFRSTNEATYRWTPTRGLSCADCPDPVASPSATTFYSVEASDAYGCASSDTIIVGVPSAKSPPEVACSVAEDGSITFAWTPDNGTELFESRITGNSGPQDWIYQGNNDQFTIKNVARREEVMLELRYFIGGDPVNCSVPVSTAACTYMPCDLEVSLSAPPKAVSCFGQTDGEVNVMASGGDMPYEFFLDGSPSPQTGGNFSGLRGGEHLLVVRDTGICVDSLSFFIPEPDEVAVNIQQTLRGCPGASANSALAVVSGGNGNFSFRWSDNQNRATATGLDSVLYTVTATDPKGCSGSAERKIKDLPAFSPNIIQSAPSCFGYADGQLAVNNMDGGLSRDPADYSYKWSTGATGPIVGDLQGEVSYSVTITSQEGCQVVARRTLKQPAQITFDIEEEKIKCAGDLSGAATVTNIQGDNRNFTIQWDASTGNQSTLRAQGLRAGTYTVTVTDEVGCFSTQSVALSDPPIMEITPQIRKNRCNGDREGSIRISIAGGVPAYDILWSNGAAGNSLDSLPAGTYQFTVTDNNGCAVTESVAVEEPPALQAGLDGTNPSCFGLSDGVISVSPGGGIMPYLFSIDNQEFTGSGQFAGLSAGNYQVAVKDKNGCLLYEKITLSDPPEFSVDAGPDLTISLGDSISLSASSTNGQNGVEYVWNAPYEGTLSCSECLTPISRTFNTITYELYAIDGLGCEAVDFVTVNVEKIRVLEVPTGFTPNGDGVNDLLLVHGKEGTRIKSFRIYDRWGELLFEASDFLVNDPNTGWDGAYRGQALNSGIFVWYAEVEYLDGAEDAFKGQTTLIR